MQLAKLLGPELRAALESEPEQVRAALEDFHPEDIAELVQTLDDEQALKLLNLLPVELAADVLEQVPDVLGATIVSELELDRATDLLTEMSPDDRADLIQELPDRVSHVLLAEVQRTEPQIADEVRTLAAYDDDTAGGLMTPEFVALAPELTAQRAIEYLRAQSRQRDLETIYQLYVVEQGRLVGVVSLRDLILGDPDTPVRALMTENVVTVSPLTDQEEVARTMAKYDLSALPVVDSDGQLLGLVTVDDVVDVVIEEATEDAQRMGAVEPIDDSYFDTGFFTFFRKRLPWLVVLFVGELLTTLVMDHYEAQMALVMDLVIFVPLIISSGGNSGSQSSSLVIRALALGEMVPGDWLRVFGRELGMGLALGLILGLVGFSRVFFGGVASEQLAMGLSVAISIVSVVSMGTLVGSLLPLLIQRLGADPAVSSTPFVASLVDVFGLIVYFTVARLIFAALL